MIVFIRDDSYKIIKLFYTSLLSLQIEVDQIFALNPTLVVQPKPSKPTNKRISSTPVNKVCDCKQLRCSNVINNGDYNIFPGTYQCSLYQFTVKCFLLDFAECKKWKSLGVFSKSLHTFRSKDCLFNHVVPIQCMNSPLKSWYFKIDSDC